MPLKVLHLGDICGVPYALSSGLRRLGVDSQVVALRKHRFGYPHDVNLDVDRYPRLLQPVVRLSHLLRRYRGFDIYHLHSCAFLPFYLDAPILKAMGKKIVYHHHGDDVYARLYFENRVETVRKGAGFLSKLGDLRLVSTPDLLDAVPDAVFVPNAVDTSEWRTKRARHSKPIRIFHAPTHRLKKGTDFLVQAVDRLSKEGRGVFLDLCEGVSRAEFKRRMYSSDIVVDQLRVGWYGVLSVEALAAGKPVCVHIRADLKSYLGKNPPFQFASTETLYEGLLELIQTPALCQKLSLRGPAYVKEVHDPLVVARRVKALYDGLF